MTFLVPLLAVALGAPAQFEDRSDQLDWVQRGWEGGGDGGYGVAWLDGDGDGDLDLFFPGGIGTKNAYFVNERGVLVEAAAAAGLDDATGASAALAVDLDNDGDTDLVTGGDGGVRAPDGVSTPLVLWANQGDGTFLAHPGSGLVVPGTSAALTAGDYDGDSLVDLFVAAPGSFGAHRQDASELFHNEGGLTFRNVSANSGVDTRWGGCAATFTTLDDDARIDLVVANCNEIEFVETPLEMFVNQGGGTFDDRSRELRVFGLGFWMGLAFGDFDRNGHQDFFVSNTGPPSHPQALYFYNPVAGTYSDRADDAGVAKGEFGWGSVAADFDNDGLLDLYYAGSFPPEPLEQIGPGDVSPGYLFSGNGDGTFAAPVVPLDVSCRFVMGVAEADYDGDGFSDLVVTDGTLGYPAGPCPDPPGRQVLLRNRGNANHWLTMRLVGTRSNRSAVGALVRVVVDGVSQLREVQAGSSTASTNSPWPTVGLGTATRAEVCVRWPDGRGERFGWFDADRREDLVEGGGLGPTRCDAAWRGDATPTDTGPSPTDSGPPTRDTGPRPSDTGAPPPSDTGATGPGGTHTGAPSDTGAGSDTQDPADTDAPSDTGGTGTESLPTDTGAGPDTANPLGAETDTASTPNGEETPIAPEASCTCRSASPGAALAWVLLVPLVGRRRAPRPTGSRGGDAR